MTAHTPMDKNQMIDLRDEILSSIADRSVTAAIIADDAGIVAETDTAIAEAGKLGLMIESFLKAGTPVQPGDVIARLRGTPKQIAVAEEGLIGLMAKPSGVATAMRAFIETAGQGLQIVSGAWKKMPPQLKESIRRAIIVGGGRYRITPEPFIYLDKNYIEMLGGIQKCLSAVAGLSDRVKVVQLKGRYNDIAKEACEAAACGAAILFIDTGLKTDIQKVSAALTNAGLRSQVKIAFGGNIKLADIEELKTLDIDILDIGRPIVDAPLLDMRLEVENQQGAKPF